jgi:hypothetical protein
LQVVQREVAKAWDIEAYYSGLLLDGSEGPLGSNPSPNYILGMEEAAVADGNVPFAGPAPIPEPTSPVRGWAVNAEVDIEFVEIQLRTVPTSFGAGLPYGPAGAQIAFQIINLGNTQYTVTPFVGSRDFYWLDTLSPNLNLQETHQTYTLSAPLPADPGDLLAVRIFEIAPGMSPSPGDLLLRIY